MSETTRAIQGTLVVLRGNSGSGKSTVARGLREACSRKVVWIEQDYVRRIVLAEAGGEEQPLAAVLIEAMARSALEAGHVVVVEGILDADRYGPMLERLQDSYPGRASYYYFSIPFDETLRRHATRPLADDVSAEEMRGWYRSNDLLGFVDEAFVDPDASAQATAARIIQDCFLHGSSGDGPGLPSC
jgi:predicted kinase